MDPLSLLSYLYYIYVYISEPDGYEYRIHG